MSQCEIIGLDADRVEVLDVPGYGRAGAAYLDTYAGPVIVWIGPESPVDIGTSPAQSEGLPPWPLAWWGDAALRIVPDWTPDALLKPYSIRESDYAVIRDSQEAIDRQLRRGRALSLGYGWDAQTGAIIVPDDTRLALIEPWMVRASEWFSAPPPAGELAIVQRERQRAEEIRGKSAVGRAVTAAEGAAEAAAGTAADKAIRETARRVAVSVLLDPLFWISIAVGLWLPVGQWIPLVTYGTLQLALALRQRAPQQR